jgi:hypothetical protein
MGMSATKWTRRIYMARRKKQRDRKKLQEKNPGVLKTVGLVGLASALNLASPASAELREATQNLSLMRRTAMEGQRTGHMVLDGVFNNLRSTSAAAVCHTDSHSSSHTSGGGIEDHTSTRKRVLHAC